MSDQRDEGEFSGSIVEEKDGEWWGDKKGGSAED